MYIHDLDQSQPKKTHFDQLITPETKCAIVARRKKTVVARVLNDHLYNINDNDGNKQCLIKIKIKVVICY